MRQRLNQFLRWRYVCLAILILITFVGALLRAYHLGFKPLWYDEALTFWIAQDPINEALAQTKQYLSSSLLFLILTAQISHSSNRQFGNARREVVVRVNRPRCVIS